MTNKEMEVRQKEAQVKVAEIYKSLADKYAGRYSEILDAYATKELSGQFLIPLPKSETKTYSATEIGNMLGVSAKVISRLANQNNLKTKDYGEWVWDKKKFSDGEVQTFRYYDNAISELKNILKQGGFL